MNHYATFVFHKRTRLADAERSVSIFGGKTVVAYASSIGSVHLYTLLRQLSASEAREVRAWLDGTPVRPVGPLNRSLNVMLFQPPDAPGVIVKASRRIVRERPGAAGVTAVDIKAGTHGTIVGTVAVMNAAYFVVRFSGHAHAVCSWWDCARLTPLEALADAAEGTLDSSIHAAKERWCP